MAELEKYLISFQAGNINNFQNVFERIWSTLFLFLGLKMSNVFTNVRVCSSISGKEPVVQNTFATETGSIL